MLYEKDRKIYVKVSGKFVEVTVKKDKNGYDVTPIKDSKKIEEYGNQDKFTEISIDKAYAMIGEIGNKEDFLKD